MAIPRIVIAGTHSGAGKTSVSLALMASFNESGHRVRAFKAGPDFIDPGYHRAAAGTPSHNLDSWLLDAEALSRLFVRESEGGDIAIIEGVSGLFDGFGAADETGSTAQISKILKAPVLLVVDTATLVRSAAAIVQGYAFFDREVSIRGIILNRVGGAGHLALLKETLARYTDIPVVGALYDDPALGVPERHLGLTAAPENPDLQRRIQALLAAARGNVAENASGLDLAQILRIAQEAPEFPSHPNGGSTVSPLPIFESSPTSPSRLAPRIGVAQDKAFSFYYQANLDLLQSFGAELVPFSPLQSRKLPEDLNALYLGGGFPEVYAAQLEHNESLLADLRGAARSGMPIYAECGGLMLLSESIETLDGRCYAMARAIPGKIAMTPVPQNFGYKEGEFAADTIFGAKGSRIKGHEFHYSVRSCGTESAAEQGAAYRLKNPRGGALHPEGFSRGNVLASYVHLHFATNPAWAQNFVKAAEAFARNIEKPGVKVGAAGAL